MVSRRVLTLIKSITLVVPLLTLGATVRAPANGLHADDCLAAPNSLAPEGSWWYYQIGLAYATQTLVFACARPIASTGHGYDTRNIAFNSGSVWASTLNRRSSHIGGP
jgi:hypothetical protein